MSALKTVTVSRRTFLKRLGAGAAAATLAPLALAQGPWVRAQQPFLIGMANPLARPPWPSKTSSAAALKS